MGFEASLKYIPVHALLTSLSNSPKSLSYDEVAFPNERKIATTHSRVVSSANVLKPAGNNLKYPSLTFLLYLCGPRRYIYRPQTRLREGNVFTPVCGFVHGRGGYMPLVWRCLHLVRGGMSASSREPQGRHPPGKTSPLGKHPLGRQPLLRPDTPTLNTTRYGQQAGGTHPTRMHSCLNCYGILCR